MTSPPSRIIDRSNAKRGFTLIELSIVLVIIGLIVGGILTGQELIRAAEIRATVSQVEKFNSAANTFRGKYGYLPGDMPCDKAQAFSLFAASPCGTKGLGDGNGLIQDTSGLNFPVGETLIFWRHLSEANLIDGSYGISGNSALTTAAAITAIVPAATMYQSLPPAKSGKGGYWIAYASWAIVCGDGSICDRQPAGTNSYGLFSITSIPLAGFYGTTGYPLTPIEAYNIDKKIDDGMPNTGGVEVRLPIPDLNPTSVSSGTPGNCMVGTSSTGNSNNPADTYNIGTATGGNVAACGLRIKMN